MALDIQNTRGNSPKKLSGVSLTLASFAAAILFSLGNPQKAEAAQPTEIPYSQIVPAKSPILGPNMLSEIVEAGNGGYLIGYSTFTLGSDREQNLQMGIYSGLTNVPDKDPIRTKAVLSQKFFSNGSFDQSAYQEIVSYLFSKESMSSPYINGYTRADELRANYSKILSSRDLEKQKIFYGKLQEYLDWFMSSVEGKTVNPAQLAFGWTACYDLALESMTSSLPKPTYTDSLVRLTVLTYNGSKPIQIEFFRVKGGKGGEYTTKVASSYQVPKIPKDSSNGMFYKSIMSSIGTERIFDLAIQAQKDYERAVEEGIRIKEESARLDRRISESEERLAKSEKRSAESEKRSAESEKRVAISLKGLQLAKNIVQIHGIIPMPNSSEKTEKLKSLTLELRTQLADLKKLIEGSEKTSPIANETIRLAQQLLRLQSTT